MRLLLMSLILCNIKKSLTLGDYNLTTDENYLDPINIGMVTYCWHLIKRRRGEKSSY